jgi:hypothetical protein
MPLYVYNNHLLISGGHPLQTRIVAVLPVHAATSMPTGLVPRAPSTDLQTKQSAKHLWRQLKLLRSTVATSIGLAL